MSWRIRSAVLAFTLLLLGTAVSGVSPAAMTVPGARVFVPIADTLVDLARLDPFGPASISEGTGPHTAPGSRAGTAFTGEEGACDDSSGAARTPTVPRDGSVTAALDEARNFSQRSFLAPQATGPPAA